MVPNKVWYRASRDAWYTTVRGKKVMLAKGRANKAEAQAAFHKVLAGIKPLADNEMLTATLCDLFLDFSLANHSQSAFENYKHFLTAFCKTHGRLKAEDIRPFHVTRWVDAKKKWNGAKLKGISSSLRQAARLISGRAKFPGAYFMRNGRCEFPNTLERLTKFPSFAILPFSLVTSGR